ncbi:DPOA2 polymerase, partial [Nycticryphes semicollaris]|nr:DPOA2 polymerase [Nycticryphes semicollaris]
SPNPSLPVPAEQRMVLVACGPYTTSDSVAYEPLADLLEVIARDRPDVCVLEGGCVPPKKNCGIPQIPLFSLNPSNCQLLGSFGDVFKLCLKTIVEGTRSAGSQLVLVPSLRDVHHDFVYPQPPFSCPDLPRDDKLRVHLVPEPCTLDID